VARRLHYDLRLEQDGTPLRRRYFCSKDAEPLEADDIVRGYEVEKDQFVIVKDEELEALAPEKSREIDLKRFVPLDQIDPIWFEALDDLSKTELYERARELDIPGRSKLNGTHINPVTSVMMISHLSSSVIARFMLFSRFHAGPGWPERLRV